MDDLPTKRDHNWDSAGVPSARLGGSPVRLQPQGQRRHGPHNAKLPVLPKRILNWRPLPLFLCRCRPWPSLNVEASSAAVWPHDRVHRTIAEEALTLLCCCLWEGVRRPRALTFESSRARLLPCLPHSEHAARRQCCCVACPQRLGSRRGEGEQRPARVAVRVVTAARLAAHLPHVCPISGMSPCSLASSPPPRVAAW